MKSRFIWLLGWSLLGATAHADPSPVPSGAQAPAILAKGEAVTFGAASSISSDRDEPFVSCSAELLLEEVIHLQDDTFVAEGDTIEIYGEGAQCDDWNWNPGERRVFLLEFDRERELWVIGERFG